MEADVDPDRAPGPAVPIEELAGLLCSTGHPDLNRIVGLAARTMPHGAHGALTVVRVNQAPTTVASTSALARRAEIIQHAVREGPCLDAAADAVLRVDDLTTEARWPEFTRRCVEVTTVRAAFGVRLGLRDPDRAALTFYAERAHAFDDRDFRIGATLAPIVAMALANALAAEEAAHMRIALQSSRQIGTAIGILMARGRLTSEQAFTDLSRTSQLLNRKLRDVAAEVEQTGELPRPPDPRTRRQPPRRPGHREPTP